MYPGLAKERLIFYFKIVFLEVKYFKGGEFD